MTTGNKREKQRTRERMKATGECYTRALTAIRREHLEAIARDRASQTGETFDEALRVVTALRDGR